MVRRYMGNGLALETDRVRRNTATVINERIDASIRANLRHFADRPRFFIDRRIESLQREWDIERVLEANASSLALTGIILGLTVNRRWFLLSGTVMSFLLLHAVQGWCPPVPVLRRLGVRTRSEIDRELLALRYMRGDFEGRLPSPRMRRRVGALVGEE
jgi:hypothetical protein